MNKSTSHLARLFPGVFILIGLIVLGFGVWNLMRSLGSEHWPVVNGTVQSATMQRHSSSKGGSTYSAELAYDYEIAGSHYTGRRLAFGTMSSSAAYAQGILNRYPVGQKVAVHYSPDDPNMAVLETGIHGGTWLCFGIGAVFVMAGGLFLQITAAAIRASKTSDGVRTATVTTRQPPVLMGLIFIVMGSFAYFMNPAPGVPQWIGYTAGSVFVFAGLFMLAKRLENPLYAKILGLTAGAAFLIVLHWISFGPGPRLGTATSTFSGPHPSNVKTVFAVVTILADLALLAGLAKWLKRSRD